MVSAVTPEEPWNHFGSKIYLGEDEAKLMSAKVRVGVIGTSWFTTTFHLPALASHPQAEVTAICGLNRARAEDVARKFAIPRVLNDYRELIEYAEVDAVLVASPDDMHYPMAMAVIEAGKHLLCEKPSAVRADLAREMYEKAQSRGIIHQVMYTFRWAPEMQYLRQLVENGTLGKVYHGQVRYLSQWGLGGDYNWRYDRQRANGALGDLGSHAIDLARVFFGEITRVAARVATYVDRPGADGGPLDPANDAAVLLLEFFSGAQAALQVSAVAHSADLQVIDVELHGALGSLSATLPWQRGAVITGVQGMGRPAQPLPVPEALWCGVPQTEDYMERFVGLLQRASIGDRLFVDSILAGRLPQPNLYDGWKAQQVVDAALSAHDLGQWVKIE